jgi:hypothetical protein
MYAAAAAAEGPLTPLPPFMEGLVGEAPAERLPVGPMEVSRAGNAFEEDMVLVEGSVVSGSWGVEASLCEAARWRTRSYHSSRILAS